MIGEIYRKTSTPSGYAPSKEVCDFTGYVKRDFYEGNRILQAPWPELNERSVIDDENRGKKMFNTFVEEGIDNPADAWKWKGTRSIARNKAVAMHANLTAAYIIPMFMAQNENDETDQDFSEVMRDLAEWMVNNSEYKSQFLSLVFGMLTNPVTYFSAEYAEVYQKIKQKDENGQITTKEIMDEVLSGFQSPVYGPSEILITNAYERNMQRQRVVIKREYVEYSNAKAEYENHPNWKYVTPGIKTIYNDEDGLFYDVKDKSHYTYLVEKTHVGYRRDDTEVCFINGIYFGDEDVDANPMHHRDNRDAPKYNVVPFGYSRIGEHFFYYKSMMNVLGWDNMLIDAMYEITMNRELLDLLPPIAVSGQDKIDSDLIFPSAVIPFADKDTKISNLLPPRNPQAGYNALRAIEDSISDSSVSDTTAGQLPAASQKAYSVSVANVNAQKTITAVGKSLGESICQYGQLMADIAVQHLTVPQVDDILSGDIRIKYRTFVLHNKNIGGKEVDKQISFDPSLMGSEMNDDDKRSYNLKLLEKSGYPDHKKALYTYNPELFARMRYLTRIEPQDLFPKNEEFMQAMLTNLYAELKDDPLIEREALLRKLLYSYFRSDANDLVMKKQPNPMPLPGQPMQPTQALQGQPGQGGGMLGQMVQAKTLSTAIGGGMGGIR